MLPFKYGRPMQGGVEIRSPPRFLERSAPGVPRGSPAPLPASPSPVNPESEGSGLRLRESPTWCFLGLSGRGAPEAWQANETGLEEARTPRRGRAGFPSAQRAGVCGGREGRAGDPAAPSAGASCALDLRRKVFCRLLEGFVIGGELGPRNRGGAGGA